MWLTDDGNVHAATVEVASQGKDASDISNVSRFIIEYAIEQGALERIPVGGNHRFPENDPQHTFGIVLSGGSGVRVVQEENLEPRPDLLSATPSELNNYYHPIAVAGYITKLGSKNRQTEQFIQEYPAFKAWVTSQPDITIALRSALEVKSIIPSTIEAVTSLRAETAVSLHTGLL